MKIEYELIEGNDSDHPFTGTRQLVYQADVKTGYLLKTVQRELQYIYPGDSWFVARTDTVFIPK